MPTPPLSDNAALNAILDSVNEIEAFIAIRYTDILATGFEDVTDVSPLTRAANATAVKTVIVNQGGAYVQVTEDNKPALIVPPMESRELNSPGVGEIIVSIIDGTATTATACITTYINIPVT